MKRSVAIVLILAASIFTIAQGSGVPRQITYQGQLTTSSGGQIDTTVDMTFAVYSVSSGGSAIWTETHPGVVVAKGLFFVYLGETNPITDAAFSDSVRFLGIKIGSDSELTPRTRLVTVPWAFRTATIDGADGGSIAGDLVVNGKGTFGQNNSNTGTNGFVAGADDSVLADFSSIGGGQYSNVAGTHSVIAGGYGNRINPGCDNSTIGGGVQNIAGNIYSFVGGGAHDTASGQFSVVSGGEGNRASGNWSSIGGGRINRASGEKASLGGGAECTSSGWGATVGGGIKNISSGTIATVAGGGDNVASGHYSTVAGGQFDTSSSFYSTVGGGDRNLASGQWSTVPGGMQNEATADFAFSFGRRAKANHIGTLVWADGTDADFASTGTNQFLVRASGGVGIGTNAPTTPLQVNGLIYSSLGGFKFPDGTVQTTASGSGGNADMVDGFHASATPTANALYPLDASATLALTGANMSAVMRGTNSSGPGINGISTATSANNYGVMGNYDGSAVSGAGVYGFSNLGAGTRGVSGSNYGVKGSSTNSDGVYGESTNNIGVHGISSSLLGVFGECAKTGSTTAYGVRGSVINNGTGDGVGGDFVAQNGGTGWHYGLTAYSHASNSSPSRGIYSSADNSGSGVVIAGQFDAQAGGTGGHTGVAGFANGASAATMGGSYGDATNTSTGDAVGGTFYAMTGGTGTHYGAYCVANGGTNARGIFASASGASSSNYAGYFSGNVTVTGTLSKGGGSFKIDHPLDPENKYLYHSFVESPDMKNIYDGSVTLDETGTAVVFLPDYFEALNSDFRYQLTCIGEFAPVYVSQKVIGNQFTIAGGKPGLEVSWQVTGTRKDPFAEAYRIPTEVEKSANERGKYLYPEVLGMPATMGVDYSIQKNSEENRLRKVEGPK